MKLILLLAICAAALVTHHADASSHNIQATLWVPNDLLQKEKYYGIIVVESSSDKDLEFAITTNNAEIIKLSKPTVTIPQGKHHGIIEFETKEVGSANIYAIRDDLLLEKQITVRKSADTPNEIDLKLPSTLVNVLAREDSQTGYVFLLNTFQNPVMAKEPINVILTSRGDITLHKNVVTIEPGMHYAKFAFKVKGEGTITAAASNLDPDTETITISESEDIQLNIAIAPDSVPTSSSAEIYFWLERGGKPYLPPHDVKITLSIDRGDKMSFNPAMKGAIVLSESTTGERKATDPDAKKIITQTDAQLKEDSKRDAVIKKGTHYGKLTAYTSFDSGTIMISGLAESVAPNNDDEIIKETQIITINTETSNSERTDQTEVVAYPDPPYDKVEIIVSRQSEGGPVLDRKAEDFVVFTNNKFNPSSLSGTIVDDQNYAIVVTNVQDFGTAEIFAEIKNSESREIEIIPTQKYIRDPKITITTLPVIFGMEQDLFLITSAHDKIITDPTSAKEGSLISITSKPPFAYKVDKGGDSVLTVSGKITDLAETDTEIHVSSNAFTATDVLDVYNPTRNTVVVMHPTSIFPEEPFPLVTHVADLNKNPIKKSTMRVSSNAKMSTNGDMAFINETGSHGLIFYGENTVPVKTSITVGGFVSSVNVQTTQDATTTPQNNVVFTYEVIVENGEGSGTYREGENVTINAPEVLNDMIIYKKKFAGWANLPYKTPTATFVADSDVETRPMYQDDFTMIFTILGPSAGIGALFVFKKRGKKSGKKKDDANDLFDDDDVF
ncbi:MAG: hypothetical protein QW177_04225 [Candidatus Nitrosotenuis sp.]